MKSKSPTDLKELLFDMMLVGLPKDCAWVGDKLVVPPRSKGFTEKRGKQFDEAAQAILNHVEAIVNQVIGNDVDTPELFSPDDWKNQLRAEQRTHAKQLLKGKD